MINLNFDLPYHLFVYELSIKNKEIRQGKQSRKKHKKAIRENSAHTCFVLVTGQTAGAAMIKNYKL